MEKITARRLTRDNFDWVTGIFIIGYHLLLLILLPIYFIHHSPPTSMLVLSGVLLFFTGISVTGGYHRLYSHSAYKTNPIIEAIFLFFGTMSTQGSALRWSYEHRIHHAFVDKDNDPYCIKKGFWYAHLFWLFFKGNEIDKKVVADLYRNKLVMFQHKYYGLLMVITNLIPAVLIGYFYNDYLSAFLFAWGVRLFFSHHFTWFINSLAHYWGTQTFSQEHTAVDNYIISLVTWGEGYHNYHHTFANDYRNGIKWYHFDPTKWLIWGLHKLGLAHNLRRMSSDRIARQMILERKNELLERMNLRFQSHKHSLEEQINKVADHLIEKLAEFQKLIEQKKSLKKEPSMSETFYDDTKKKIDEMKRDLKTAWKEWKQLSKTILETKTLETT
ncbi:MAG: acyl-CoA desaturase [Chlamydiae bacterium]|jgi:stearoyl-CoA desaturase (delta-9 desaturase)|nr:acyl-CoA desaturase [Chlamydiota bacterium]